jgi:hypothetical protein
MNTLISKGQPSRSRTRPPRLRRPPPSCTPSPPVETDAIAALGPTCAPCVHQKRTRVFAHLRATPRRRLDAIQNNEPPAAPVEQAVFSGAAQAIAASFLVPPLRAPGIAPRPLRK